MLEDKYLDGGRLRLRVVSSEDSEPVFKLGKKYIREGAAREQVVTIYLTEQEYRILNLLPGKVARKLRYSIGGGSLDVYELPSSAPAIFEVEFASEAAASAYAAPAFVAAEITSDANYNGYAFAQGAI